MEHAHAALPCLQLDAKRIAATSGVIALHVGVLMMLMMPPRIATPEVPDEVIVIQDWKPLAPPPPPPPPPVHDPVQPHNPVRQPLQVAVQDPVVEPVDQTPNPIDIVVPDIPQAANTFETGQAASVFVQLVPDISPAPPYPRMAMQRRLEGKVVLRIHVDASGKPIEVSVENSSGSSILDEAAMQFVKARWHFVPAQQDGRAMEAWALLPIDYVLR